MKTPAEIPIEHDVAFMEKCSKVLPGVHQEIVKQKKRKEREIPRYLRRLYGSKKKKLIENALQRAYDEGFSKEEIEQDFNNRTGA